MQTSDATQAPDFADDLGPAFHRRPSSIERVGGEWRGQLRDGGVDARVMRDATLYDRLYHAGSITRHHHDAADRLYGMWCAGHMGQALSGGYGQRVSGRDLSAPDDAITGADEYRASLRRMPIVLTIHLDALMLGECSRIEGLRQALDWLVREWRL